MNSYVEEVIKKYRNSGVILDTNILLLYCIGSVDTTRVISSKRLQSRGYTQDDYMILDELLRCFRQPITTPNILTEVSNFLGQMPENLHALYFSRFSNLIPNFDENYIASSDIANTAQFNTLGLTDSGIIQTARNRFLIITDDFKLSQYSQHLGVDALNFNHIRELNW